jgi:hypothetical protein
LALLKIFAILSLLRIGEFFKLILFLLQKINERLSLNCPQYSILSIRSGTQVWYPSQSEADWMIPTSRSIIFWILSLNIQGLCLLIFPMQHLGKTCIQSMVQLISYIVGPLCILLKQCLWLLANLLTQICLIFFYIWGRLK